jgi:hypothetical protein
MSRRKKGSDAAETPAKAGRKIISDSPINRAARERRKRAAATPHRDRVIAGMARCVRSIELLRLARCDDVLGDDFAAARAALDTRLTEVADGLDMLPGDFRLPRQSAGRKPSLDVGDSCVFKARFAERWREMFGDGPHEVMEQANGYVFLTTAKGSLLGIPRAQLSAAL